MKNPINIDKEELTIKFGSGNLHFWLGKLSKTKIEQELSILLYWKGKLA